MTQMAASALEPIPVDDVSLLIASALPLLREPQRVSEAFYRRVFELAPGLRVLFGSDLSSQQAKVAQMLVVLIGALQDLSALRPQLRAMGAAHQGYGVGPMHYQVVCDALLDALIAANGGVMNVDVQRAWSRQLVWVSREMLMGTQQKS